MVITALWDRLVSKPITCVPLGQRTMTLTQRQSAWPVPLASTALKDPLVQLPLIFVLLGKRMTTLSHRQRASTVTLASFVM